MLRLISYLAPSIPTGFFEVIARAIREGSGLDVELRFEESISGPLDGDPNPFAAGTADVGFVCSPTYQWLREEVFLLPVPVPADPRANGKPVYFSDVVVSSASRFTTFGELRGGRFAYNDMNSLSGWLSMVAAIAPLDPREFFADLRHAGSHVEGLRLVRDRHVDAAAIDSNVLLHALEQRPDIAESIRTIESWGPFPIQPVVIRDGIPPELRDSVRVALLRAHEKYGTELRSFGFLKFVDTDGSAYQPRRA